MLRWLVLAVLSTALPLAGCGSSVRAGLANAPRLGGATTADNRVTDVVSNGDDSCGAYAEHAVLRYRVPPCPGWTAGSPPASQASQLPSSTGSPPSGALVEPWLDHFYVGWPCPVATSSRASRSWSSPSHVDATCSVP